MGLGTRSPCPWVEVTRHPELGNDGLDVDTTSQGGVRTSLEPGLPVISVRGALDGERDGSKSRVTSRTNGKDPFSLMVIQTPVVSKEDLHSFVYSLYRGNLILGTRVLSGPGGGTG